MQQVEMGSLGVVLSVVHSQQTRAAAYVMYRRRDQIELELRCYRASELCEAEREELVTELFKQVKAVSLGEEQVYSASYNFRPSEPHILAKAVMLPLESRLAQKAA